MPIKIHGNDYVTVAERVQSAHKALVKLDIQTEVLSTDPNVVIKATVTTKKGVFTGISAANPDKAMEKTSPYEIAETSAIGRALGFAGYGSVDSIATADEMVKAGVNTCFGGNNEPDKTKKKDNDNNQSPSSTIPPEDEEINVDDIDLDDELDEFDMKPAVMIKGKLVCGCGRVITPAVNKFSTDKYGHPYCMNCQNKVKKIMESKK